MRFNRFVILTNVTALAPFGAAAGAFAQTAAVPVVAAAAEAPDAQRLPDIIVTAQKRSQNLQRVPVTITAITAADLKSAAVSGMRDLNLAVPGVTVSANNGGNFVFVRGVGQTQANNGIESPVAMYVDGIYLFSQLGSVLSFNDISQIEVLKGPQGTLFGRNATGGVIQVFTKAPSEKFAANGDISYANYDTVTARAYVTGGLVSGLTGSAALYVSNQGRGYGRNVYTGKSIFTEDSLAGHIKLQYRAPDGATTLTLNGYYDKNSNDAGAGGIYPGYLAQDGVTSFIDRFTISARSDVRTVTEQTMGSFKVEHDMPWATIMELASAHWLDGAQPILQNKISGTIRNPVTGATPAAFRADTSASNVTYTNEFQLQAPKRDDFQWVAGLFLLKDISRTTQSGYNNDIFANTLHSDIVSKSVAVFGQATKTVLPATRFTAGIRYTKDHVSMTGDNTIAPVSPAAGGIPPSFSNSKVTYRLTLDHSLADNILVYGSYNTGFKAGRYVNNNFTNQPLLPETIAAWEVGFKSQFLDKKIRLNTSLFTYNYSNLQVRGAAPTGTTSISLNAAKARGRGVDVDIDVAVTSRLRLTGGFEYFDGIYTSFPRAPCPTYNSTTSAVNSNVFCDLSGASLPRAPKFSGTISAVYSVPTPIGGLSFSVRDGFSSSFNFEPDGRLTQPSYHNLNASVGLRTNDGRYGIEVYGSNLLNAFIYGSASTNSAFTYFPGKPRLFGVRLSASF